MQELCFYFHIRGCSLQEPQLIVVVANVHELCALWIKVLSDRQQRDFVRTHPHSWHLFAVFTRTHPHSHNRGQTSQNRSALMPHSRVFITFMQVALIRTHGGIMTFSPHSSARSLRLCIHASSTLASERMLSRNLCAAWMCFSMPSLPYHHPNRWFSYMSQNNIKPLFFWKIILSQKNM